jgi:hypothetical protein
LLLEHGWYDGKALGKEGQGIKDPIGIIRHCLQHGVGFFLSRSHLSKRQLQAIYDKGKEEADGASETKA